MIAIASEAPKVNKKSNKSFGLTNKGEITPAENQVTEIFPKISEVLSRCLPDNFFIYHNVS